MMLTDKPNLQFRVCNIKRRMLVPLDETAVRSKHYVFMYRRFRLCPRPPPERANVGTYVLSLSKQGGYVQGKKSITCTRDSCYAEVSFNITMYYFKR